MRGSPTVTGVYGHRLMWLIAAGWVMAHGSALAEPQQGKDAQNPPGKTQDAGKASDAVSEKPAAPDSVAPKEAGEKNAAGDDSPSKVPETEPAKAAMAAESSSAAGKSTGEISASTYAVKLRDLEQRINELKEQIFRSKARLSLLAETVLQGVVAGSQAVISHENRMSSSYRLVKATYALDGAPIFNKADEEGSLGDQDAFEIYHGSMVPGEHTLTVNLEYRGHGFGVFSYLKGYRFKVRSNHTFTAPEGKGVSLRVIAYEKGGPAAPLEDRPAIRFAEKVTATRHSAQGPEGRGAE
ncbi:MAG: hypothetical protein H6715_04285 [Myxococcales bacterium]|nr:hypothetical protein [Myxococcales bacterium]